MPHRHHHVPREPLAEPVIQTVYNTVYVLPSPTSPPAAPPVNNGDDNVTRRVGPPLVGTPGTTSSSAKPTPPVRHQRPSSISSSHSVSRTNGSPLSSPQSHKTSSVKAASTKPLKTPTSLSPKPSGDPSLLGSTHGNSGSHPPSHAQDQGMSGGAKAGIAIGLILAFALIGALIFLVYRRKKNQNEAHQPLDDEKTNHKSQGSVSSHVSVRKTVANAPRLSLRPVTEMFPTMSEKQDNVSASTLIANSAASARSKTPEPPRTSSAHVEEPTNPFGDDAEAASNGEAAALATPPAAIPKPLSIKSERTGSGLSDQHSTLNDQGPAAPGTASGARRLSPPGPGPNNVHRVQLDFNPSMDDELGLRAGQLVRMLHEYDDGWALCIRLDRSQQGVVPRTCISKLPVKPRPQGPATNARGPPPQGRPRGGSNAPAPRGPPSDLRQRPAAPQAGRMRSQSNAHQSPRAQSPGSSTSQSGMSQGRPRANSDAVSARRITPPTASLSTSPTQGGAIPIRKPVPGQAM